MALFSHEHVRQVFFADGQGTKHALAEILAKRFPEELGSRLPPKRRAWMSEDSRMDIFDAVALALLKPGGGKPKSLRYDASVGNPGTAPEKPKSGQRGRNATTRAW